MSTFNPVNWVEFNDPYGYYRLIFMKSSFTAVFMVFIYMLIRPSGFSAYMAPVLVVFLYEQQVSGATFYKKDMILWYVFSLLILGSVSFYLLFPFKVFFLFYAVAFLTMSYYLTAKRFPQYKNASLLIIAVATISLSLKPSASLLGVYEIILTSLVSMMTIYLCLLVYPNRYHWIWLNAARQFIICLEKRIAAGLLEQSWDYAVEIPHLNIMHAYRRLVPVACYRDVCQLSSQLRNVEFAFFNRLEGDKSFSFWWKIRRYLQLLRAHMRQNKPMRLDKIQFLTPNTQLQQHVVSHLTQIIIRWNRLCSVYL